MNAEDLKDRWLRAIFIAIMANSIVFATWAPLFFVLEPGQPYRHISGLLVSLFVIPAAFVYGLILAWKRTEHMKLKVAAVILNFSPILIILLIVKLLAIMGHLPAE